MNVSMQKIKEGTIKPQHDSLSWFGYKDLTCPCPTSTPRVSNSRVSSTINKLLYPAEKILHVAYYFTDTKLNVEFFTKGTTTPVLVLSQGYNNSLLHFVFYGTNTNRSQLYTQ